MENEHGVTETLFRVIIIVVGFILVGLFIETQERKKRKISWDKSLQEWARWATSKSYW